MITRAPDFCDLAGGHDERRLGYAMGAYMTSSFHVHDADGYDQIMGRWSRKLAPLFIDFAGIADGEKFSMSVAEPAV